MMDAAAGSRPKSERTEDLAKRAGESGSEAPAARRLRRASDGGGATRAVRRRRALETLRQSPVRNGLVGLAVAGTAAPIAVHRHQQALRMDPSHESIILRATQVSGGTDEEVQDAWQGMVDEEELAAAERTTVIQENVEKFASYGLSEELAGAIYDAATEHEIDPDVAFGLVRAESSFRNSSTSPVGAIGLTQLMPRTAQWLEPGVTRAQLREPGTNLRIGFKYLRQMLDKYNGDERLALLAYNRGPGTVDRELRNGRNPDNGYADFVHGREGHGHKLFTGR